MLPHPMSLAAAGMRTAVMLAEAQAVMTLRLMGLSGFWPISPAETRRMWAEKAPALADSWVAATRAGLSGQAPDRVLDAAVAPLGRATRGNLKRLQKAATKR